MSMLFSPLTINNTTLKNRVVMAPMCIQSSDEKGFVKDFHLIHYGARAIGQAGLIILEATSISLEGRITNLDLGIWSDEHITGLKKLANLIKEQGSTAGIQIAHAGRKSRTAHPISCSNVIKDDRYAAPKEMSLQDIADVQQQFIDGVKRAVTAGFEVIEIHAAHGYLINQFLSPITNHRKDQYGDSAENRSRFLKEILYSIREFYKGTLFVRISATDYLEDGLHVEDYIKLFQEIEGVDFIDVSSGGIIDNLEINTFPAYQVPLAEALKKQCAVPIGAVGIINTPQLAEEILQQNQADLIFIGRQFLRNPNWAVLAAYELGDEISIPHSYTRMF